MQKDRPRRNAFETWVQAADTNIAPPSPVDMIAAPKKRQRDRAWERNNPARSYIVPRRLWETARQVCDDILSIAQYDEHGEARDDRTTVNAVASALMDWALTRVEHDPSKLNLTPNPHSRGHLTVSWKEASAWGDPPIQLPMPKRRGQKEDEDFVLSYRWSRSDLDRRIRTLAGTNSNANHKKKSPFTYTVPIGEVVVKLLRLAVEDYKARRFKMTVEQVAVSQTVAGWEVLRSR